MLVKLIVILIFNFKNGGEMNILLLNLTIELEESGISIDYKPYKNDISSVILD
jgi:hypothetical protein